MFPLELPNHVKANAIGLATRQSSIPESPASFEGGGIELCAAACIARAVLNDLGERDDHFIEALQNDGKLAVVRAFEKIGLSATQCHAVMKLNDQTPTGQRLDTLGFVLGV